MNSPLQLIIGPLWLHLGRWLERKGLEQIAETCYRNAASGYGKSAVEAGFRLSQQLLAKQRFDDAATVCERALRTDPNHARLWCALGAAQRRLAQMDKAGQSFQQAIQWAPDYAQAWNNLGEWHLIKGDLPTALDNFEQAIKLEPRLQEVLNNRVATLFELARFKEAEEAARSAIDLYPRNAALHVNLGNVLLHTGKYRLAVQSFRAALDCDPNCPEAQLGLATLLGESHRLAETLAMIEHAIAVKGESAQRLAALAQAQQAKGDWPAAEATCEKVLAMQPNNILALITLGACFSTRADHRGAISLHQLALVENPQMPGIVSSIAFNATYLQDISAVELFDYHREWADRFESIDNRESTHPSPNTVDTLIPPDGGRRLGGGRSNSSEATDLTRPHPNPLPMGEGIKVDKDVALPIVPSAWVPAIPAGTTGKNLNSTALSGEEANLNASGKPAYPYQQTRQRDRPLRIGYVSGDFGTHPVGFLLRDVMRHHDRQQFLIHCYSMMRNNSDNITVAIRENADAWVEVFFMDDDEMAGQIHDDQIDILVDLSGHTAYSRLPVFVRKPAPVQATWIGYFNYTGLQSIDYFITDPFTSPKGCGQLFSEIPVWLPHSRFCYSPPDYAPDVSPPPLLKEGQITFGSFNRIEKLVDPVIAAWAEILDGLPGSRLLIKSGGLANDGVCDRLRQRFSDCGLASERLELRGPSQHVEMLEQYGEIDIALDPFPFNGGMTTLEALWMGVPVVTVTGNGVVSRQSFSALENLGLHELIFPDLPAYIQGAIALAGDRDKLAELRQGLRPRMVASPICQAGQFTRDLESLYRNMWRAWCSGERLPSDLGIDDK